MFSRFARVLGAVVLATVLLGGCGELPRPYKTRSLAQKIDNPMLSLRDNRVIYVAPVRGTMGESGALLAAMISNKLHDWDILSTTRGTAGDAYYLAGGGRQAAGQLYYQWALKKADGTIVEQGDFILPSSSTAWTMGRHDLLQKVADRTAADISKALKPTRLEAAAKAEAVAGAHVAMGQVTGAPGDGNKALIRSLRLLLKNADVPLTDDAGAADIIVGGKVAVAPVDPDSDQVTLTWIMTRPDGSELARIKQENRVPKGSLDGRWGDAAYYAATAVLPSVVEVHSIIAGAGVEDGKPQS